MTDPSVADRRAALRRLFPEAFDDSGLNLNVLATLVGEPPPPDYALRWHGMEAAQAAAATPSTATWVDDPDGGQTPSRNLFIEGDNLDALKLLRATHAGRVKLVCIDPPYNTGRDFVYADNYRDSVRSYRARTGRRDGDTPGEVAGRFHTAWLNMMLPRLVLAREMLREDGALIVFIDDNEVHNLRILLDMVFGTDHFIATCAWQKSFAKKNKAPISGSHDHVLVVARDRSQWRRRLLPRTAEQARAYRNLDRDPRGVWRSVAFSVPSESEDRRRAYRYAVTTPSGAVLQPPPGRHWNGLPVRFDELLADNRLWFGPEGDRRPRVKLFLSEVQDGIVPDTWWTHEQYGHNQGAKRELLRLFGDHEPFSTPKPTRLIRRILQFATAPDTEDIVLDFFAGSGTTGAAVLRQNAEDGGNRSFVLVQNAAPTGQTEWPTIAAFARERLRREAALLTDGPPGLDLGFCALKTQP